MRLAPATVHLNGAAIDPNTPNGPPAPREPPLCGRLFHARKSGTSVSIRIMPDEMRKAIERSQRLNDVLRNTARELIADNTARIDRVRALANNMRKLADAIDKERADREQGRNESV